MQVLPDAFALKITPVNSNEQLGSDPGDFSEQNDDYMELYVAKELSDKLKPLNAELELKTELIANLRRDLASASDEISRVDVHFTKILKTLLQT